LKGPVLNGRTYFGRRGLFEGGVVLGSFSFSFSFSTAELEFAPGPATELVEIGFTVVDVEELKGLVGSIGMTEFKNGRDFSLMAASCFVSISSS